VRHKELENITVLAPVRHKELENIVLAPDSNIVQLTLHSVSGFPHSLKAGIGMEHSTGPLTPPSISLPTHRLWSSVQLT
jgi:hypothetical protein